jgi:putative sigma-54 modulation protein
MKLQVKGRNLPVTDALFEHAERKLGKLARILPPWDEATQVELELSVERNPSIERRQVAEITVHTKGPVLRVRESAGDMYQAIDQATHKMERQAGRYRDRRRSRRGQVHPPPAAEPAPPPPVAEAAAVAADDEPELVIVKNKRFAMRPMAAEDAAMQLELLQHDFYVFRNAESGRTAVVYRRRDGAYGLIEPEE